MDRDEAGRAFSLVDAAGTRNTIEMLPCVSQAAYALAAGQPLSARAPNSQIVIIVSPKASRSFQVGATREWAITDVLGLTPSSTTISE
jgi:hypothetical protein